MPWKDFLTEAISERHYKLYKYYTKSSYLMKFILKVKEFVIISLSQSLFDVFVRHTQSTQVVIETHFAPDI